jgi:hypothetical protein
LLPAITAAVTEKIWNEEPAPYETPAQPAQTTES